MKYHQLSQEERYIITSLLKSHLSYSEIARQMGRSPSTISRELSRNLRPSGYYAASKAQSYATARRKASRRGSQFNPEQWSHVLRLIQMDYSPEQAVNILKQFFGFSISHETIYQYILYDKKKGGSWYKHLRIMPKRRRKRYNSYDSRGKLGGKRMIDERPDEINQRLLVGHWEADTVIGKDRKHCIVTLVERKTGYLIIKKVNSRTVEEINRACIAAIREHGQCFKTITFDPSPLRFSRHNEAVEKPHCCWSIRLIIVRDPDPKRAGRTISLKMSTASELVFVDGCGRTFIFRTSESYPYCVPRNKVATGC